MVACDFCETWYHCDCVGVLLEEAKDQDQQFCDNCSDIPEMYSIDQGQLTDIRKLTREEHRMLKTMDIPKASEDTLRVANKLLETVS